jgi:hypothetical protein
LVGCFDLVVAANLSFLEALLAADDPRGVVSLAVSSFGMSLWLARTSMSLEHFVGYPRWREDHGPGRLRVVCF